MGCHLNRPEEIAEGFYKARLFIPMAEIAKLFSV
jgi:hypothetical protein